LAKGAVMNEPTDVVFCRDCIHYKAACPTNDYNKHWQCDIDFVFRDVEIGNTYEAPNAVRGYRVLPGANELNKYNNCRWHKPKIN